MSNNSHPRNNIELKARVASLDGPRRIATDLATERLGEQHQVDTYFCCRQGRLKLREITGETAQLIGYERADAAGAKASNYTLVPIDQPDPLRRCLAATLGIRAVVEKHREIFLYQNVRIHLDQVNGLGCFLEFEAVLSAEADATTGHKQVDWLCDQFQIVPDQTIAGSYVDLIE